MTPQTSTTINIKLRDEPTGSFNSNNKRKTVLGEPNNNNNNNNNNNDNNYNADNGNNNNNNNFNNSNNNNDNDYTNDDNASVDDEVSPSEGDTVRRSRRTRTQPDRLTYNALGGVAALPDHLTNTSLYLFYKARCTGRYTCE